jgi:DNA-binding transcriptional LysR family regulator
MTDLAASIEQLRGSADTVTLVISPTAADALLSAALMRMQSERNAPVEVVVANSRTVKRMVAASQVDVGLARSRSRSRLTTRCSCRCSTTRS